MSSQYATDLLDRVAEPLLLWHKEAELRLKRIILSEEKLESQITALKARLKSERALCIKGWTELTKDYKDWQKSLNGGDAKKIEKLEKNFLQKREKLRTQFQRYEQLVDAGNAEQKAYWTKELPAIVTNYEVLEVERCNELEARLLDFRTIQSEYSQPFPGMLSMVDLAVKGINGPKELRGFVEAVVASGGRPEPPLNFVDGLPADSRALLDAANQNTLGALLNQEPNTLAAQREMTQLKTSGNVMGTAGGEVSKANGSSGAGIGASSPSHTSSSASTSSSSAASSSSAQIAPSSHSHSSTPPSSAAASAHPPPPPPAAPSAASSVAPVAAASAAAAAPAAAFSSSSASTTAASAPSASDPFNRAADPDATFVRALYDFTSEDADDLTFTLNTVIKVTLKGEDDELAAEAEEADPNAEPRWWRGQRLENIGKSRDGTFPSNYVRVCGVERDMSLRHLLEIPSGLRVFSEFLGGEYATENIHFWVAVEKFRDQCMNYLNDNGEIVAEGHGACLAEAERIAREYIGGQAASQVNISSATLKLTQDRIASLPTSLSLNMFDEAGTEHTGEAHSHTAPESL